MQIFTPYPEPIKCAEVLWNDKKRFNKQIIECRKILQAIQGESEAWKNHPVTNMYREHIEWIGYYLTIFTHYKLYKSGKFDSYNGIILKYMQDVNEEANKIRPPFLTEEFCDQHKRRLYSKSPELYPQFEKYGKSDENWYYVNGEIVKYKDGKRLNKSKPFDNMPIYVCPKCGMEIPPTMNFCSHCVNKEIFDKLYP